MKQLRLPKFTIDTVILVEAARYAHGNVRGLYTIKRVAGPLIFMTHPA